MFIEAILREFKTIYTRLRLQYYLLKLRLVKQRLVDKKFGIRKVKNSSGIISLLWKFCNALAVLIWDLIQACIPFVWQLFYTDKHPSYLKMLMKEGSKERHVMKMTIIYLYGFTYCLVFFYINMFILEALGSHVVIMCGMILSVCCILALNFKCAFTATLLIVPNSVALTARTVVIAIILFQLNIVAFSNINYNYVSMSKAIKCENKALKDISSLKDKHGATRFNFVISKESPLGRFIDTIKGIAKQIKQFYKDIVNVLLLVFNMAAHLAKTFNEWLKGLLGTLGNIFSFLLFGLNNTIGLLVDKVIGLIMSIFDAIANIAKEVAKKVVKAMKKAIKNLFSLKFNANYVFNDFSNQNSSIHQLLEHSKKLTEKHDYAAKTIKFAKKWTPYCILFAFIQVLGSTFYYYTMFLHVLRYDNHYITDDFKRYNLQMMKEGKENIFPFFKFEQSKYTTLRSIKIADEELIAMTLKLTMDCAMTLYISLVLGVDFFVYKFTYFIKQITYSIADDILPREPIAQKNDFFWFSLNSSKFQNDYELFQEQLKSCAPEPTEVDIKVYLDCYRALLVCIILTLIDPYVKRIKTVIMYKLYPELKRPRMIWLYNHILFMRIIEIMIALASNPQTGFMDLEKVGSSYEDSIEDGDYEKQKKKEKEKNKKKSHIVVSPSSVQPKKRKAPPLQMNHKYSFIDTIAIDLGIKMPKPRCAACHKEIKRTAGNFVECANMQCDAQYCIFCFSKMHFRCCKCDEITDMRDDLSSEEYDSSLEEMECL